MSYTVLARKYRSRTFDEVVGQEHIATTLANAIKTGRIHHGYLFTGTRGVGKTSMARILAKSLNCLSTDAPTTKPCLKCDACIGIAEGQDIDVVEIDAASNTGVDNIRELRSNAAFRPARCRFKIYIIDEVHMLSTGAFNALLKTLEEPPPHVKFILATTEIQKVPATIQSRCQRFNFRNIGPEAIAGTLDKIIAQEGFDAEPAVIRRVARLANGSMRDALSILDQLLSVSPKKLTAGVLDEVLPPPQDEQVFALLERVAEGDVPGVLAKLDEILSSGRGLEVFCNDVIDVARSLMLLKACGPDATIVDISAAARAEYVQLAGQFELSHYVQMIAMFEELKRNARFSGAGRALCDALLVRLTHLRSWTPIEQIIRQIPGTAAATDAGAEKKKSLANPGGRAVDAPSDAAATDSDADAGLENHAKFSFRTSDVDSVVASATRTRSEVDQKPANDWAGGPTAVPRMAQPARGSLTAAFDAAQAHTRAATGTATADAPPRQRGAVAGSNANATEAVPVSAQKESAAPTMIRVQVSAEERARIMADPLLQRAIETFDGVVVSIERTEYADRRLRGIEGKVSESGDGVPADERTDGEEFTPENQDDD